MRNSLIPYLKYAFLGVFLVASTGVAAYDFMYTKPKKKCDAEAKWWSEKDWKCFTPVNITNFTGRPVDAAENASPAAAKAAEKK
jgi:hypothetical protein